MQRVSLSVFGAAAAVGGLVLGSNLSGEAWTAGAVGFPLLLAAPGLALLAKATEVRAPRYLLAVVALAVALIGLDVTDSARPVVVVGGYLVALAGAAAAVGALVLRRPQGHRA